MLSYPLHMCLKARCLKPFLWELALNAASLIHRLAFTSDQGDGAFQLASGSPSGVEGLHDSHARSQSEPEMYITLGAPSLRKRMHNYKSQNCSFDLLCYSVPETSH